MRRFISPSRDDQRPATESPARVATGGSIVVGGWLLVLCVMLTMVGPLISIRVVATEFDAMAVQFATSREAQWATILDIALTTGSIVFGIHAGYRLRSITPGAVSIARASMLFASWSTSSRRPAPRRWVQRREWVQACSTTSC